MAARTPSPPPFRVPHNTPGTCHVASSNGETNPAARSQAPAQPTLSSLLNILLPTATLAHPPPHTRYAHLTPVIAELSLYPPLEAALHLLNSDLASAHFLVRHMNGSPAVEGMLLHSILHRSEGDFNNARAWLVDVRDACEGWVPKQREQQRLEPDMLKCMLRARNTKETLLDRVYGNDSAEQLIDDVEKLREKSSTGTSNETTQLEERIRKELEKIIEWCRSKFGDGKWVDASSAWVRPGEEVKRIGNDMVSGNKGWRKI